MKKPASFLLFLCFWGWGQEITVTFEGHNNGAPVGTVSGVTFSPAWVTFVDSDVVGQSGGNFANEPSPGTAANFTNAIIPSDTRITLPQTVNEISFFYSLDTEFGSGEIFFLNEFGTIITTAFLTVCGSQVCGNNCQGDPTGVFCSFTLFRFQFPGIAAVEFDPSMQGQIFIDDVSFTLDNQQPDLAHPSFIRESHFYITEEDGLAGFLPDPNSDGVDPTGNAGLHYVVTLEDLDNCEQLAGPLEIFGGGANQDQWPRTVLLNASVPSGGYYIGVSRRTVVDLEKRGSQSNKTFVSGPSLGDTNPATTLREIRRWLPHVPRPAGGFDSIVEIDNPNPLEDATVLLTGFDDEGNIIGTRTRVVPAGDVRRYAMYTAGSSGLYATVDEVIFSAFTNQISHVGIWERTQSTQARLFYIAANTQYAAPVEEYSLETAISGVAFELQSAIPNDSYFDGVAVVNLTSELTPNIFLIRRTPTGTVDEVNLGTLPPGSKRLAVLSGSFNAFVPYSTYTIESRVDAGSAPIQILGLSGQNPGVFFHSVPLVRKR